jgi:IclR family pca regulon transcriptional regulator
MTRFCYTLSSLGYLRRDARKRYHLTPRVLSLGYAAVSGLGWRRVAEEHMRLLSQEIGASVNLSILEDGEALILNRVKERILPYDLRIGSKLPLYCSAVGKVLVAFGPPEAAEGIFRRMDFKPITHKTITNLEDLRRDLAMARERGYAVNDEELSEGIRSLAAPIRGEDGWVMAALGISVSSIDYTLHTLVKELAPKVIRLADNINRSIKEMELDTRNQGR